MSKDINWPDDRAELYALLLKQVDALIDRRRHAISTLANAAALIYDALEDVNWAGFYLMHEGGVCGAAARQGETVLVEDVHKFAGHIACDSASRSEIVVPLRQDGRVIGVMDIDSPRVGRFDGVDRAGLEAIAALLGDLDYDRCGY